MNVEGLYNTMKKLEQYYSDKFTFTLEQAKEKWGEEPLGKMKLDLKEPNKILPRYRTTNRKVICQCENNHFFPVRKDYFNTKYCQCPICDNTAIKALGEKYHRLTIVELDHIQGYEIYFKCLCDCGKYTVVTYNYLKRKENPIQSCGCLLKETNTSQTFQPGDKIGRLTIIKRNGTASYGDALWDCLCSCGRTCNIATRSLTSGRTQSCGCLITEKTYEAIGRDITNQTFGYLIALYPLIGTNKGNGTKWHCRCNNCGKECDIALGNLTSHNTISCGCLSMSKGEFKINQLLNENNIDFIQEYKPNSSDLSFNARFDFYIPKENYIIEYDGIQHFQPVERFGGKEEFIKRQQRDKEKNEWCKKYNISIIRIPYTHYELLNINDLKLNTSNFIL